MLFFGKPDAQPFSLRCGNGKVTAATVGHQTYYSTQTYLRRTQRNIGHTM